MQTSAVIDRVERVAATCGSPDATHADITAALSSVTRLESYLAGRKAELVAMLSALPGAFPEADIADTSRCSLGQAGKDTARADTLGRADAFAEALLGGDITAGHVDALTRAGRQLDDSGRAELFDQQIELAGLATDTSIAEFDKLLKRKVKEIEADDGESRLDRQKRATRLRTWVDADEMWCLSGRFDPETGVALARRLRRTTEAMFAESTPGTAPGDPVERQRHLEALALARLMTAGGTGAGSGSVAAGGAVAGGATAGSETAGDGSVGSAGVPSVPGGRSRVDAVVVVDASQSDGAGGPLVDWGLPVELSGRVLEDLLGVRAPDVVVVANGVVLHAPGQLDLGRSTRLANRAQRRALRGLYATCAVPGCTVHVDRCKLHHVVWWRHGGRTDLDNLLPVCSHHHTKIHDAGWEVTLGARRELTITLPGGRVLESGPPKRSAA